MSDLSPFMRDVLALLLVLWPSAVILRRVGLPLRWLLVLPLSLILPLLGHMLLALVIAVKPWPKLPATPPVVRRKKAGAA